MSNDTVWTEGTGNVTFTTGGGETVSTVPTFSSTGDVPADVPVNNPADVPPTVAPPPTPAVPAQFKGLAVRADGDKVFILKGGRRFWVTSPAVFTKLGFKFGDEVKIDLATLNVIPEGEPLR